MYVLSARFPVTIPPETYIITLTYHYRFYSTLLPYKHMNSPLLVWYVLLLYIVLRHNVFSYYV